MKIIFAGLKTTGKVETVWALIRLDQIKELYPGYNDQLTRSYGANHGISDYVVTWGRRGGKLRYTVHTSMSAPVLKPIIYTDTSSSLLYDYAINWMGTSLVKLIAKNHRKGYIAINTDQLSDVYPEFESDLTKICFWENLKL